MTRFIETNGIRLAYDEQGSGAETLIVMHGLTANMHSFGGLMAAGLADGYRVLRVDLRGRGLSDKPERGYHMRDHAADIIGLMDALAIEQATLVGHSFGGLLSVVMANLYPERIKRIVIIDAGKEATELAVVEKIKPSLERLRQPVADVDEAIAVMRNAPYYTDGSWDDDIEQMYRSELVQQDDGSYARMVYADGIYEAIEHILEDDWDALLRGVQRPALLIHAPASFGPAGAPPILSEEGAQETIDLIPDCAYKRVDGHHITMLFGDNAAQVVSIIHGFAG